MLLLWCLPRAVPAQSCVGEDSPPSRRGWDRAFRLSGNGAFGDYAVQLPRGKPDTAAASSPPPAQQYLPRGPQMPTGTRQPPHTTPEPLVLPGGCQRWGEGGRVTQGDTESQFQLLVPATGTQARHTWGVTAGLIITTLLQGSWEPQGEGRNPLHGSLARARGPKVSVRPVRWHYQQLFGALSPPSTTASQACLSPRPAAAPGHGGDPLWDIALCRGD